MAVLYRDEDVASVLTPPVAIAALEEAMRHEAAGSTAVPGRLNAAAPDGWIRLMPAVIDGGNGGSAMGFKVMNLNRKTGVRYIAFLYDAESGELEAIIDAARLTRLRTASVTAIAYRAICPEPAAELGVFGSGHEAEGHVETFSQLFPQLQRVVVYSPRQERREAFAERMSSKLGIAVEPTAEPEAAAAQPVSLLATKTTEPVARSEMFPAGAVVLSIGSTRPDLRELDEAAFGRARQCVADAPAQLVKESGDVQAAVAGGFLSESAMVPLADLVAGTARVQWPPEDLIIFKSVGTALQDLAVSSAVHAAAKRAGIGYDLGWEPVRH